MDNNPHFLTSRIREKEKAQKQFQSEVMERVYVTMKDHPALQGGEDHDASHNLTKELHYHWVGWLLEICLGKGTPV